MISKTLRGRGGLLMRLSLSGLMALVPWILLAQSTVDEEHLKKADYISGLPAAIGWPPEAFSSPTTPYVICVYKDWAFTKALTGMAQSLTFSGHPVTVRKIENEQEAHECHILWISQGYAKSYPTLLTALRKSPVLTVGEDKVFTQFGGGIALGYDHQGKRATVLEVNGDATDAARLKISSKLMRLAKSYISSPPQSPTP